MKALNEPSQVECGAPDFIVEDNGVPIGHVECKDVGADLRQVEESEQLKRYREGLPNLILTNYLDFRWYVEGSLREAASLGHLTSRGDLTADKPGVQQFAALLDSFFTAQTPSIDNPRDLAKRMAAKARLLNEGVTRILALEGGVGPLHDLLRAYREILIGNLSPTDFADLQAQTAAYGLFAARCRHRPDFGPFTRQSAVFAETTPLLRDVFGRIAGPGIDPRISWIVDDLARLLDRSEMTAILADFGRRTAREDPVVHFYEDFLAAYNPRLREMRGVYYTPEPVVSYIVRSVDLLLRDRFGLSDGLADTTKITVDTPEGTREESPRVLILDPAAGTGTFLREVIATIRTALEDKGLAGAWPHYVRDHLLPRLLGLELMMAPYAICHLKLALEIAGTEAGPVMLPYGERLNVFLTNTLEEPHEALSGQLVLLAHAIAQESASADAVKRDQPVMVILGNPPYSGHSPNKGQWIIDLIDSYKRDYPDLRKPGQAKWLSDDYVKFIRFAQWRIERTGEGVLAFVTNHTYLDNPTFRGMRESLMDTFDEMYLLDLHGNSKRKERTPEGGKDENVFDIQQGVAIGLFVKRANETNVPARVFHSDLWGEREKGPEGGKYGWLSSNHIGTTKWKQLSPKQPQYFFIPRDETYSEEYEAGWSIAKIFAPSGDPAPGIVTTHDQFAISWDHDEAVSKVERFLATTSEADARTIWRLCTQSQWDYKRAKKDLSNNSWRDLVKPILYRLFDVRSTVYDRNVAVHRRERVMRHMLAGSNLALITCRQQSQAGIAWSLCSVSRHIIESSAISNKTREINYLFPLYTYPKEEQERFGLLRQANLESEFVDALGSSLGLQFESERPSNLITTFGPEDTFHYIYAILHSPGYRRRYADFLKSDFPRIPVSIDKSLFEALANLGERLKSLHLMESKPGGHGVPVFPKPGDNRVDKVRYELPTHEAPGRVFINHEQFFEGVEPETWDFVIGGYRPAYKWLKDRRYRILSYKDIIHYREICAALAETLRIMVRIDEVIELHGGWPIRR